MAVPHQGLRFTPPPLTLTHEHRWLLLRAFGPISAKCESLDAKVARRLALASSLAPRIATRTPSATLKRELGNQAALVKNARRQALSHVLAYEQVVAEISAVAERMDQRVVLLKGFALNAAALVAAGSREVGDLDILVESDHAEILYNRLTRAGFTASGGVSNEHHLPPLKAPRWGVVDLHFSLRGVSGDNGRWLSASEVLAQGEPIETHPGCWVPDRAVLAAHAVAHAVEQHAMSPNAYPLLRSIADLIDLLPGPEQWEIAMPRLAAWLKGTVSAAELTAMRDLGLLLHSGRSPSPSDSPAGRLLAHFLAHHFDKRYRAGLAGANRRHRLKQAWERRTLLRYVGRKMAGLWRRP